MKNQKRKNLQKERDECGKLNQQISVSSLHLNEVKSHYLAVLKNSSEFKTIPLESAQK